jgi:HlyD family secretion protein
MKYIFKKTVILPALAVIVIGGLFAARVYSNTETGAQTETTQPTTERVSLISVGKYENASSGVKTVGTVEALDQVDLKSQLNATVTRVPVELGQEVKSGDVLVELDHADQDAQIAQARAGLKRAQNQLDQVLAGAKDEEVRQAKSSVDSAQANLDQAKAQLEQTITQNESAIEQAELALEAARDQVDNSSSSNNQTIDSAYQNAVNDLQSASTAMGTILNTYTTLQYAFFTCNDNQICHKIATQKEKVINQYYDVPSAGRWNTTSVAELEGGLDASIQALVEADTLEGREQEIETTIDETKDAFNQLKSALSALENGMASYLARSATSAQQTALQNARTSVDSTHAMLTGAKQRIENAKISSDSTVDSSENSLEQARQQLDQARAQAESSIASARSLVDVRKAALDQAKASYESVVADPRNVDIAGLQASVDEARARVQQLANQREKAFIRAPFDAKIAALPAEKGSLTSAGTTVASLINEEGLQVSMFVNEQERKRIKENDSVTINDGQAEGVVTNIAPSIDQTTKKIELIAAVNNQIQPLTVGEFVHAEIATTDKTKAGEFTIPFRAIKNTSDSSYVYTTEDNTVKQHEVTLGRVIGERVVVKEGLSNDMRIIASVRGLEPGQTVEIENE